MNKEILCKPFARELIKERAGPHGKHLRYVDINSVIQRLNEGSDNWSFEIANHQILDCEVVVLGRLTLDGVTKSAFGGSLITLANDGTAVSIGDDLKAAASDCLKKSASLFGIGLELYGGKTAAEPSEPRPRPRSQDDPKDRATVRQMAALQGAARRRGLTKDRLSSIVHARTGKTDLAELDRAEASSLISELSGSNGTSH
jgi:hypothetical protein